MGTLPHDLEAEQSLLGAMILSARAIPVATAAVTANDFYKPAHAIIFDAIAHVVADGKAPDVVTLSDELRRIGQLDTIGGPTALVAIQSTTPTTGNVGAYASIVADHAERRRLILAADKLSAAARNGDAVAIASARSTVAASGASRETVRSAWSACDLLSATFPEINYTVPGLIADGVTLLVGGPKVGKSWVAYGLSIAVASGGVALGKIPVAAGDVLYAALEDPPRRLQQRLRAILGDDPAPDRLDLWTECQPIGEGGEDAIRRWLDDHPDAKLVTVDVLAKVRPRVNVQANRYDVDYAAIGVLKAMADRYGVAFLVLHHTRKATAEDFVDSVSGTHGLAGAADAILALTRSRGNAAAVLKVTGRDIPEAELALTFDGQRGTWSLLDGLATDYELRDTRRSILQLVREAGPLTPQQIAGRLGITPASARQTCKRMADDGQLDVAQGVYTEPLSPVTAVTLSLDPESDVVT